MKFNFFPEIDNGHSLVLISIKPSEVKFLENMIEKIISLSKFTLNSDQCVENEHSCLIVAKLAEDGEGMLQTNNYRCDWSLPFMMWQKFLEQIKGLGTAAGHIYLESLSEADVEVRLSVDEYSDAWWAEHGNKSYSELKSNWRKEWLDTLNDISNPELQNAKWLDANSNNPYFSFVEFWSVYFDDLGLSDGYELALEEALVSVSEHRCVLEFHNALKSYQAPNNADYDHEAILADPKWLEITNLARKAIDCLSIS